MPKSSADVALQRESQMSNAGWSRLPVQLEGQLLVEMKASGHVNISARDDALHIQASFGDLIIPYTRIDKLSQDVTGGITIGAGGAKTYLAISDFGSRIALFRTLEEKANRARRGG